MITESDIVVTYEDGAWPIFQLGAAPDLDGDGFGDVAAHLVHLSDPDTSDGEVLVDLVSGALRGTLDIDSSSFARLLWGTANDCPGDVVAFGDVSGDGAADLVYFRADGIAEIDGPLAGDYLPGDGRLIVAAAIDCTDLNQPMSPYDLRLVDYDGDGIDELAVQWYRLEEGHRNRATEAWIFDAPFDTARTLDQARLDVFSDAYVPLYPYDSEDWRSCLASGAIPEPIGDVDGDGTAEMLVASNNECNYPTWVVDAKVAGHAEVGVGGIDIEHESAELNGAVGLGDLDGDGLGDVMDGGEVEGDRRQVIVSGLPDDPIDAEAMGQRARIDLPDGSSEVVRTGDLDGDGRDDLTMHVADGTWYGRTVSFPGAGEGVVLSDIPPLLEWTFQGGFEELSATSTSAGVLVIGHAGYRDGPVGSWVGVLP